MEHINLALEDTVLVCMAVSFLIAQTCFLNGTFASTILGIGLVGPTLIFQITNKVGCLTLTDIHSKRHHTWKHIPSNKLLCQIYFAIVLCTLHTLREYGIRSDSSFKFIHCSQICMASFQLNMFILQRIKAPSCSFCLCFEFLPCLSSFLCSIVTGVFILLKYSALNKHLPF